MDNKQNNIPEYTFDIPDSIRGEKITLSGPQAETDILNTHIYYREGFCTSYDCDHHGVTCFYEDSSHPENYIFIGYDAPGPSLKQLKLLLGFDGSADKDMPFS